jgi:microcin C transport system permease protein
VIDLIKEKLPVSISLGLWITLMSYGISIPLGIKKAVRTARASMCGPRRDHRRLCDPGLPVRDPADRAVCRRLVLRLVPAARADIGQFRRAVLAGKIVDYFWHLALPLTALALSAFATTTLLTKNSFSTRSASNM